MSPDELEPPEDGRRALSRSELRARGLALGGLAAILLVIVAAAASGGFALDERGESGLIAPRLPSYAAWVLVPLLVLSVVASLTVLTQVVIGRQVTRPTRVPLWAQFATLILVVLALVALQRAGILGQEERRGREAAEPTARPPSPPPAAQRVTRSAAFGVLVTLVLGLVLVGILVLMLSILRKERGVRGEMFDPETTVILDGVDAGIDDLATIHDPRAAVIACYARLEAALSTAGIARRPSEAPLEFLERVLVERRVVADSAARLTTLFERARFSTHDVDEAMRSQATSALVDARSQLRGNA
ncbi:MAG TPA: DUF4129 domain-containing protein [Actinomycetota bacterium]|jgi:hypothetical protein